MAIKGQRSRATERAYATTIDWNNYVAEQEDFKTKEELKLLKSNFEFWLAVEWAIHDGLLIHISNSGNETSASRNDYDHTTYENHTVFQYDKAKRNFEQLRFGAKSRDSWSSNGDRGRGIGSSGGEKEEQTENYEVAAGFAEMCAIQIFRQ